jgi:hypothetical protein
MLKILQLVGVAYLALNFFVAVADAQCPEEASARFQVGRPTTIMFENRTTNQPLSLFKIDRNGTRQFVVALAPLMAQRFNTFDTEPWVVAVEKSGICLSIFRSDNDRTFPITQILVDSTSNQLPAAVPKRTEPYTLNGYARASEDDTQEVKNKCHQWWSNHCDKRTSISARNCFALRVSDEVCSNTTTRTMESCSAQAERSCGDR